jgi:ligand-binding SRPBCC domain-containing protein
MELTVEITAMERPVSFRDEEIDGPFEELVHEHDFEQLSREQTRMTDTFRFTSPYGVLGGLVDRLVLKRYMRRPLGARNVEVKTIAERR